MRTRGLTLLEVVVIILILVILAGLILPCLSRPCESPRRVSCAANLRQIAMACYLYADEPANGRFPTLSTTADRFADPNPMGALSLLYRDYVQDPKVFSCPDRRTAQQLLHFQKLTPTVKGHLAPGGTYLTAASCSYGYDPGHKPDDAVAAIAADKKGTQGNSDNHGANAGQNVLIGSGAVEFRDTAKNFLRGGLDGKTPEEDPDIYSPNPAIPRNEDGYIRQ
jgi:hypothetical protein